MPQSVECELEEGGKWKTVTVAEAIQVERKDRNIRCLKCEQPLRAHRRGKNGRPAAHFEHLTWNPKCPLRQRGRDT